MDNNNSNISPVIIIGAPRSGTNMLRDALSSLGGVVTWPCDEINYIWRYGNSGFPTDELTPLNLNDKIEKYIRKQFQKIARKDSNKQIVEKTCANSLRVKFVDKIFPMARYLFLVRDGRDVVASAVRRWKAPLDISYVAKKARYVPAGDLWHYAVQYMSSRLHKWQNPENRLSTWGPRFAGMDEFLQDLTLEEICAMQWSECVNKSSQDIQQISSERVLRVCYEDFVGSVEYEFNRITDFIGVEATSAQIDSVVKNVNSSSVGNWKTALSQSELFRIMPLLSSNLSDLGYLVSSDMKAS